jgi:hypothetical protein
MFSQTCYLDVWPIVIPSPRRWPSRIEFKLNCFSRCWLRRRSEESALANDQAQIVRLLEALNEGDPVQILRRSLEHDALDWVERGLTLAPAWASARRSLRRSYSRP